MCYSCACLLHLGFCPCFLLVMLSPFNTKQHARSGQGRCAFACFLLCFFLLFACLALFRFPRLWAVHRAIFPCFLWFLFLHSSFLSGFLSPLFWHLPANSCSLAVPCCLCFRLFLAHCGVPCCGVCAPPFLVLFFPLRSQVSRSPSWFAFLLYS